MTFRIALERLRAYEPRALIMGVYRNEAGCCAVGACVPQVAQRSFDCAREKAPLPTSGTWFFATASAELGMDYNEVTRLVDENDRCGDTRAERYARVLAWLEARVAEEDSRSER